MLKSPPLLPSAERRGLFWVQLCFLLAAGGLVLLFTFDPASHAFYPRCYLKALTGWSCPGCGGLRAVHQLLHGHVAQAFRLNPLFVIASPAVLVWPAYFLWKWRRGQPTPELGLRWGLALLVLAIGFGVLRNLF